MTDHQCPVCGLATLRRSGRQGPWEKLVLPLFGIYPWRCSRCRQRFRLSDRGAGYLRLPGKKTVEGETSE